MVYPPAVWVGNSPNQDPRRAKVNQIILHHTASTGDVRDIRNMFMQDNSRSVSANFLVAQNGDVHEIVNPDTGRAWTTGSGPGGTISPDHSAITMECMDSSGAPDWGQSAASCEAIAQIIAWAAKRYSFDPVRGVNVRGHREMPGQSTACPGGMPMDAITARAREILAGGGSAGPDQAAVKAALDKKRRNNVALPLIARQGNPKAKNAGLVVAVWDDGTLYWLDGGQMQFWLGTANAQLADCVNPGHFEYLVADAAQRKAISRGERTEDAKKIADAAVAKLQAAVDRLKPPLVALAPDTK